MVKHRGRRLNKKTTRRLLTWRHYVFRQLLLRKAELMRGCTVIISEEPYTSNVWRVWKHPREAGCQQDLQVP